MSRDPFVDGLFPVCVATHDLGIRRLFDLSTVLMLLDCRPGERVLDLGAGSGFSSEMLARFGYEVVAVDPDHAALRNNLRRLTFDPTRVEGHVRVSVGIAERLPFADRSFDGAVGLNVLHHVPDLAAAISEIARVLRPGARFVGCEPGLDHLEDAESVRAIREYGENDRPFDVIQFLEIASALGFRQALLPATTTVLGIDEHTACIIDPAAATCLVLGIGTVTVLRDGQEQVFPAQSTFPLSLLGASESYRLLAPVAPP